MTEENLLKAAKKIQTWIHTHPKKATIVHSVIDEFDEAIRQSEVKKLGLPVVSNNEVAVCRKCNKNLSHFSMYHNKCFICGEVIKAN